MISIRAGNASRSDVRTEWRETATQRSACWTTRPLSHLQMTPAPLFLRFMGTDESNAAAAGGWLLRSNAFSSALHETFCCIRYLAVC